MGDDDRDKAATVLGDEVNRKDTTEVGKMSKISGPSHISVPNFQLTPSDNPQDQGIESNTNQVDSTLVKIHEISMQFHVLNKRIGARTEANKVGYDPKIDVSKISSLDSATIPYVTPHKP